MKPVILLTFADYRTQAALHLRELGNEQDFLEAALSPLAEAGVCEVKVIANVTPKKLVEAFSTYGHRVVALHFAGHADGFELMWQVEGGYEGIQRTNFADFLAKQEGLEMVFLNACATREIAAEIQKQGVPWVISTQTRIQDTVASQFARELYEYLAQGKTIRQSLDLVEQPHRLKGTASFRSLYWDEDESADIRNLPWELLPPTSDETTDWSLVQALDNPLLGLPPIPQAFPQQPYRGLNWYREQDARIFFGRERETRELFELLRNSHCDPSLFVYGQSGAGKSSFLNAGLIPRLRAHWQVQSFRLTDPDSVAQLADLLDRDESLEQDSLVLVDQAEEILISPGEFPSGFLNKLLVWTRTYLANGTHRLILSFRKEYLAEFKATWEADESPFITYYLPTLSEEGIGSVITGIQRDKYARQKYKIQIGTGFKETLTADILRDKGSHYAPALQIALTRLWKHASARTQNTILLSKQAYEDSRDQGVLLGAYLRTQVSHQLKQPEWYLSGLAWDVLHFFTSELGTAQTWSWPQVKAAYPDPTSVEALIRDLQARFLITEGEENQSLRLAHDALGPLILQAYNQSDLPGQQARKLLESRIAPDEQVPEAELNDRRFAAYELYRVNKGLAGMRKPTALENALISASTVAVRAEEKQAQTRIWITRWLIGTVVFAGILAIFNGIQSRNRAVEASDSLIQVVADQLTEQKFGRAITNLKRIWELGFHRDAVVAATDSLIGRFIFQVRPDSIEGLLPLIEQFPDNESNTKRYAELTFVLAFADRTQAGETFLVKQLGQDATFFPLEDPARFSALFSAQFGPRAWAHLTQKYLPRMVAIRGDGKWVAPPLCADSGHVAPFAMGETEVTVQQFAFFYNCRNIASHPLELGRGVRLQSAYSDKQFLEPWTESQICLQDSLLDKPIPVTVLWPAAKAYADWVGMRLPSVKEAFYVMQRADSLDAAFRERYGWFPESTNQAMPVKQKSPDKWGLYDLWGNMSEWCAEEGESPGTHYFVQPRYNLPWDPAQLCPIFQGSGRTSVFPHMGFRIASERTPEW